MVKILEKSHAIKLREKGHSYQYIAKKIKVSKSTLSSWLSEIPYIPNEETIDRIGKARARAGQVKSQQKISSILNARDVARKDIGILSKRDIFMLGVGLYMGEGTKTQGIVRVINADPRIITFIIKWFKVVCGLQNENFKIRVHLYPDNNIEECLNFWSKTSTIPRTQFLKTQIDFRKDKKKFKRGKLPYGTAHLSVLSNGKKEFGVFLSRRINAWIEMVLK